MVNYPPGHTTGGEDVAISSADTSAEASFADGAQAAVSTAEPQALPPLWDATFEQWLSNINRPTHTIMSFHESVWDRDDVLPSVVFYSGMP